MYNSIIKYNSDLVNKSSKLLTKTGVENGLGSDDVTSDKEAPGFI